MYDLTISAAQRSPWLGLVSTCPKDIKLLGPEGREHCYPDAAAPRSSMLMSLLEWQDMDEELQSYHGSNTELDQANGDLRTQLNRLRQEGAACQHSLRVLGAQYRCLVEHFVCVCVCVCVAVPFLPERHMSGQSYVTSIT